MARGELPIFASDNKMVAMLQSGWAKILNPIIKQSRQKAAVAASHTQQGSVQFSADGTNPQTIPYNAVQGDVDGSFSSGGVFVAKHPGIFLIGTNVNINNSAVFAGPTPGPPDFLHIQIMQGTTRLAWQRAYGNGATFQLGLHMAQPVSCAHGDTIVVLGCTTLANSTFDSSTSLYIMRIG